MSRDERVPSPASNDEVLAMAYADGELSGSARAELEARLAVEPALAREVAAQQRLHLLARHAVGPEPMDHEWKRIARSPVQRVGVRAAWASIVIGALGVVGWAAVQELCSELPPVLKVSLALLAAGLVTMFLLTLRNRLRTLPYDPYDQVQR
jgi:anti-sigma factor RsiW